MSRQKLGQHFLVKGKTLERIAQAACGERAPLAVEIGPGRGALTDRLLAHADRVVSIELDAGLCAQLGARWQGEPRLEIVEGDALHVDWNRWGAGVLAGNLPYYVATALISKYVRTPGSLSPAVFLVQREVAERITAKPGRREYGYLSVECQFFAVAEYLFTVAPGAFHPPPKVESAAIRLTPRATLALDDADEFMNFISACFRQKRKALRNNVADVPADYGLRRAEQLSVAEFVDLYRAIG